MPGIISVGSIVDSAANVAATTVLNPTLPTRTTGDWLLCVTQSTSATSLVSVSAGWQTLWNVTSTGAHLAGFAAKTTGSETAPTVTWTGLTAGGSGTPCICSVHNYGTGFAEAAGALIVDSISPTLRYIADAASQAGGAAFYTVSPNTFLVAQSQRPIFVTLGTVVDAGGAPVVWTLTSVHATTSGAEMEVIGSCGTGPSGIGGLVTEHSWALGTGTAVDSTGIMIALETVTPPGEAGPLTYTRGKAPS